MVAGKMGFYTERWLHFVCHLFAEEQVRYTCQDVLIGCALVNTVVRIAIRGECSFNKMNESNILVETTHALKTVFQTVFRFRIVLEYHLRKGMLVYDQYNYCTTAIGEALISAWKKDHDLLILGRSAFFYMIPVGL